MKNIDLLLINPPFHRRNGSGSIFPLGLGYIMSSVMDSGFTYDFIDCCKLISAFWESDLIQLRVELLQKLMKYNPVLVGIGPCITTQVKALKIIAECCKEVYGEERIYCGGPLASIDGQEWFFFDFLGLKYIVKGDGERAAVEMLRTLKDGSGLYECGCVTTSDRTVRNEIDDIDEISFPQRPDICSNIIATRRQAAGKVTATMITSRGCPYNCRYCVSGNLFYKHFRKRSVGNILDEMAVLKETYGITDVIFYDDCFFAKPVKAHKDIYEFCTALLERKLDMTWQMEIRCDLLQQINVEDIELLCRSGCRQVNLGIEKTTSEGLKYLGKHIALTDLSGKIQLIKSISGMKVSGTFILGGKDETEEDILRIIRESKEMNLDFAHYNPLFIYPGTPVYDEYFGSARATAWVESIMKDSWPWGEVVYETSTIDRNKLMGLIDTAYSWFYEGSSYQEEGMVTDRFNLKR